MSQFDVRFQNPTRTLNEGYKRQASGSSKVPPLSAVSSFFALNRITVIKWIVQHKTQREAPDHRVWEVQAAATARKTLAYDFFRILRAPL